MLISATLTKGPVMVYCGQELGEAGMDEEGFSGRDGRTTIFDYWSVESIRNWVNGGKMDGKKLTAEQKALQKRYAKLLNICNKEKAIAEGEFFDLMYCNYENPDFDSTKQYVFLRKKDNDLLLIVSNFEDKDVNVTVNIAEHAFDYLGIGKWKEYAAKELINGETRSMTLSPDSPVAISIPAHSGVIWKITIK